MTFEELKAAVVDLARSHHVLSLATFGPEGPWAASLFYVVDADIHLYFISSPATQHCRQLASDPRVAATINGMEAGWSAIRGLQIEGQASAVPPAERGGVEDLYLERFPELRALLAGASSADEQSIAGRFASSRFYRIVPKRIRLIDNTRGFGYREELVL